MQIRQLNLAFALTAACLPMAFIAAQKPAGQPQPAEKMAVITLTNPSFEDSPRAGVKGVAPVTGWYDCGAATETPPDVQPGFFGINIPASSGTTYIGLVVRDNETWEGVGQRLSQPLMANKCYEFSIDLRRADEYKSVTSMSNGQELSFAGTVQVRVWGGNGFCERAELLHTTPYVVNNSRWLGYSMQLKPKKGSYNFILIEAYFKTPLLFPYNGNVLVDNCSAITQVPCVVKKPEPPKPPVSGPKPQPDSGKPDTNKVKPTPPPPTPAPTIATVDPTKLKKGDVLQIQNLYFDADKYDIKQDCVPTLTDVLNFLNKNSKVVIEISGHTNNRPSDDFANRLSTNRAKAVYDWLLAKGIPSNRIQYKGYGKTAPLMQNTTEEGRKKNQRVEVRILSVNG